MQRTGWAGRLAFFAVGLSGLTAPWQPCWAQEPDFAIALEAAKKAAGAEPLKSYLGGPFKDVFGARYIGWLNECAVKTNEPSDDLIEMLVTVGGTGHVQAVRYSPHSTATDCLANSVKATIFPVPPQAGLVVPAVIRSPK